MMMRQNAVALTPALSLRERVQGAPSSVILSLPAGRQVAATPARDHNDRREGVSPPRAGIWGGASRWSRRSGATG